MRRLLILATLAAVAVPTAQAAEAENVIGRQIDGFSLQDFRGKEHTLADYTDASCVVVAFLGTECPLARLYASRLQDLADQLAERDVVVIGIDSNRQDSITELAAYARVHGVSFPLLKDVGNEVADQFSAERTPEVFLLDRERRIRYRGRVDDQYGIGTTTGYAKTEVRAKYLVDAIDAVLAGRPVVAPVTEAPGCIIGRVRPINEASTVTYGQQISRILQRNCVECHREGQIAPFALTEYEEVAGWSEMIEEVVREQRMPPWHANPKHGVFTNDRSMSSAEKELIYEWVANGAPMGDLANLPEPIEYPEGWQLNEPDEIFYMSPEPYTVAAEGTIEYQYFMVDPGWTEDHWIKGSECLIDNRAVVHHIFVFAVPPEVDLPTWEGAREQSEGLSGGSGGGRLIAGAAPGTPPFYYASGEMASFVKAGTRLLFQMHYTPNGTVQQDRTCLGFTYARPEEVRHNVETSMAMDFSFRIPAGADNHPVEASRTFRKDTLLLTFAPHMHLRGKSFRYDLEYPDGTVETLLDVPRYDFNWQMIYQLAEPKFVPAGTKLHCLAHFDNSLDNLANPDPTAEVRWGDQTWEEMMIGWYTASEDIDPDSIDSDLWRTARFLAAVEQKPPRVGGLLRRAARRAATSPSAIEKFANRLGSVVPQVDRVDVTLVDDTGARVVQVAQPSMFNAVLGQADRSFAADSVFAEYARGEDVVVHDNLAQVDSADLAAMSQIVRSSLHVPIRLDGKSAMVSFWSKEPGAFPPAAVEILQPLAESVQ